MTPATTSTETTFAGTQGMISARRWEAENPRYLVLLAHGYGEHAGRYEHVAAALVADGASVFAPDHAGHGRSEGPRATVTDVEGIVSDLHAVSELAVEDHRGLPIVLIGHSLGGIIATRYAQRYGSELAALVLSGPVIGGNPQLLGLIDMDPIPDIPIDPAILSRDPAVGEAYAADELVHHGPFARETLVTIKEAVETIAAGPTLGGLPTLWLHGEEDQLAPYEATAPAIEQIKGSALEAKVYPGAQHEIFNETNKDEVIGDVLEFVGRVVAQPA